MIIAEMHHKHITNKLRLSNLFVLIKDVHATDKLRVFLRLLIFNLLCLVFIVIFLILDCK